MPGTRRSTCASGHHIIAAFSSLWCSRRNSNCPSCQAAMMCRHKREKVGRSWWCSRSGGESQCRVALLPFQVSQSPFEAQTSMRSSVVVEAVNFIISTCNECTGPLYNPNTPLASVASRRSGVAELWLNKRWWWKCSACCRRQDADEAQLAL